MTPEERLEDVAENPAEVEGDAGKIKEHSLKDLMEYANRQAAQTAGSLLGFGMRVQKIKPGGCG